MCGELLHAYADTLKAGRTRNSDDMPWQALYAAVMAPEIQRIQNGEQFSLNIPILKSWLGNSVENMTNPPRDAAFRYVKRFIQNLDCKGAFAGHRIKLFRRFIEHHKATLSFIHGSPQIPAYGRQIVDSTENSIFTAIDAAENTIHALIAGDFHSGVIDFTIYHHPINGRIDLSRLLTRAHDFTKEETDNLIKKIERSTDLSWTHGFGILDDHANDQDTDTSL